jgi:hypothetical protein
MSHLDPLLRDEDDTAERLEADAAALSCIWRCPRNSCEREYHIPSSIMIYAFSQTALRKNGPCGKFAATGRWR